MLNQTDISNSFSEQHSIELYEEFADRVERLNKTLNNELEACHKHIATLGGQVDFLREEVARQQEKVKESEQSRRIMSGQCHSMADLQQILRYFLQRIEGISENSNGQQSTEGFLFVLEELRGTLESVDGSELHSMVYHLVDFTSHLLSSVCQSKQTAPENLDRTHEEISVLISKIIELEGERTLLANKTVSTEKQVVEFRDSVGELKEELQNRDAQLEQTAMELEHAREEVERLREMLEGKERVVSDEDIEEKEELWQRLEEEYQEKEKLYDFIGQLKGTIEQLNKDIEQGKALNLQKSTANKSDIAKLANQVKGLTRQASELKENVSKLEKKNGQYRDEIGKLRKQKEIDYQDFAEMKRMWDEDQLRIQKAQRQIQNLKARLSSQESLSVNSLSDVLNTSADIKNCKGQKSKIEMSFNQQTDYRRKCKKSPGKGTPATLDTSRWTKLQEKIQFRKQYTQDLNKQVSFKLLKLRN